jgi:hypothetical protein
MLVRHARTTMDLPTRLAAAQALLGIVLLLFVPVVLLTLLAPLRALAPRGD